jgi:UDP-N-acetylglucosamine--N-acetylmuramyl-(pentapeptide) pyrophosphoryl-undecaprenol N-acetylglucosamine transferase
MRIIVSGGGSGGHITPILATIDSLRQYEPDVEILYVGQAGGMEATIAKAAGLEFAAIRAGKFRRYHGRSIFQALADVETVFLNIRDSFRLVQGVFQSRRIIRDFAPNIIFVKGGYVGLPVGLAARWCHVPYVIQESDIIPGLTNRTLAKHAEAVGTGFPADRYKQTLPMDRVVYTGNPIRPEIFKAHRLEGMEYFKLDPRLPVILVVGGGQGSQHINDVVIDSLPELLRNYQVVHVAGDRDIERVRFEVKRLQLEQADRYHPYSFLLKEMAAALACADLVVSRAGANAIAEFAVLGKPTILIPHAAGGHQATNALTLARAGAAKMITDDKLTYRSLTTVIQQILGSEEEQAYLSKAIKEFAVPDAADRLAKIILEHAQPDEVEKTEQEPHGEDVEHNESA